MVAIQVVDVHLAGVLGYKSTPAFKANHLPVWPFAVPSFSNSVWRPVVAFLFLANHGEAPG